MTIGEERVRSPADEAETPSNPEHQSEQMKQVFAETAKKENVTGWQGKKSDLGAQHSKYQPTWPIQSELITEVERPKTNTVKCSRT